jgi:hypothetical protein
MNINVIVQVYKNIIIIDINKTIEINSFLIQKHNNFKSMVFNQRFHYLSG